MVGTIFPLPYKGFTSLCVKYTTFAVMRMHTAVDCKHSRTKTGTSSPVAPEKLNNNGEERPVVEPKREPRDKDGDNKPEGASRTDEVYDIPVGATLAGLPAGTLYRVRATYRYTREDSDELSFDVGDVIRVVEYDDPDEQEEGWLMGIKETTNEKGMFPANFTRPI